MRVARGAGEGKAIVLSDQAVYGTFSNIDSSIGCEIELPGDVHKLVTPTVQGSARASIIAIPQQPFLHQQRRPKSGRSAFGSRLRSGFHRGPVFLCEPIDS